MPGTKTTSQYRGVSWNESTGQWMAVVWNFQKRKTQLVGHYLTEAEVRGESRTPLHLIATALVCVIHVQSHVSLPTSA